MKKRIFSGAQPTGELHLGNYIGALKNWVALQDEYESFYCIVDLHAITIPQDPQVLRQKTLDLARIYLAAGIDPEKSCVFVQSDVAEHAELTWVLSCTARMGELERMTQFKDKSTGKGEKVSVGLFTYPVLMAADILLYQTHLVPVGQDQKQHLELTRDLAERFNRDYGETFVIPEPYIPPVGAKIMSLSDPEKKMSKSDENLNGAIFLNDTPDMILKKFKKAVTDSLTTGIVFDEERKGLFNLLTIYQVVTGKTREEIESHFAGKGYGHLKTELGETVIEYLRPFQAKMAEIDDTELEKILKASAEKASSVASETLKLTYERVGLHKR
ncbi:MAG TPA: tryptophan--tRNA ligase [Pyrinomonadaceae bacterium]|nr:tryptophan--tRNA ligase [Pyrinomonadaceae bacterium]